MDYNNAHSRNNNVPVAPPTSSLGNQYVYNSYIDHSRVDSTNNRLASPVMMAQASGSRNSAGPRPMSMFDATTTAAASMSSTLAAATSATNNGQQPHSMTAPNTANSDRSFHAILIGENAQPPSYPQQPSAGAPSNTPFGMLIRPRQGIDAAGGLGNIAEQHHANSSLSSSLPSGNPFLRGGFPMGTNKSNTVRSRPADTTSQRESSYPQVVYPALNANNQAGDWSTPLPSPGSSHQQRYNRMEDQSSRHQDFGALSNNPSSDNPANHYLRPAASDLALQSSRGNQHQHQHQHQQQQYDYQSSRYNSLNSSYQAQPTGGFTNQSTGSGAGQMYPVSQPGLPPAGPASAYTASNRSPLVARARGRRMPHNAHDYSDANATDAYSLGSSPASGVGASLPPSMRHTRSAESHADSNSSRQDASDAVRRQPSPELSLSFHGSINSESGIQDNARRAGLSGEINDSQTMRTASAYNYPEMGYRPSSAAQDSQMHLSQREPSQGQMEMAVDQVANGYSDGQGTVVGGMHGNISPPEGSGAD
ncbi:hypothetical protein GGI22_005111, partial [Coemansia erecta]